MKSKNKHILNVILILLIIGIEIIGCFAIYINQQNAFYQNYKRQTDYNIKAGANRLEQQILDNQSVIKRGDASDISNLFAYTGVVTPGAMSNLTISGHDTVFTVSAEAKPNLTDGSINFYTLNELTGASIFTNDIYLVYSLQKDNNINLYFQTQTNFLSSFNESSFENFAITDTFGKILFSQSDNLLVGNLTTITNTSADRLFDSESSVLVETQIANNTYIVASNQLNVLSSIEMYYVGVENYNDVKIVLNDDLIKIIVASAVKGGIQIALICFIIFSIMINEQTGGSNYKNKDFYTVVIDINGDYKRGNRLYKHDFEPMNIFEHLVSERKNDAIKNGDNIKVALPSKIGKDIIVNFIVIEIFRGYKLVGLASESMVQKSIARSSEVELDERESEFIKRFEKMRCVNKRTLIGKIQINNLRNLSIMFGEIFEEKAYGKFTAKIRKNFSEIYLLPDNCVGILVKDGKELDNYLNYMDKIMDELNRPIMVEDNLVNIGCLSGFVIVDKAMEDKNYDYILKCINASIRRAKETFLEQHKTFFIYHESQAKYYEKYIKKTYNIKKMIEEGTFLLEYQPQASLKTHKIVGFESLLRVKKSLNLEVNIFELIKYAESSGTMIILGDFILNEGMKFAKSIEGTEVSISLNVSPIQFMQAGFVDNFLKIFNAYKLKPGAVCVEITESFLMTNIEEVVKKLEILQQNGINVHLDDFGMSYSSFLYLKKLPISSIKLDMEFIREITKNEYSYFITKTMINIANELKLESIAEGVETEEQKQLLTEMGCSTMQGYLIGKSMPAKDAVTLIEKINNQIK